VKHFIIFWSPPSPWSSLGSTTWHGTYHFMSTHLAQWLVPRFHQLSKTKLGLSPTHRKHIGLALAQDSPWDRCWFCMLAHQDQWSRDQCASVCDQASRCAVEPHSLRWVIANLGGRVRSLGPQSADLGQGEDC
jgi:hypothetical protein